MGEYLKIPEVARRLDISEKTARRYIRSGELPSAFIGGAYRVSEEDLASYQKGAIVKPEELTARPKEEYPPLGQDDPKRRLSPSTPRPPDFPFDAFEVARAAFEVARAAFAETGADTEEEEVSRELGQMFADALAGWPRQDLRAAYEWADHDVLKALAKMPASREELMRVQVERFAASAALQALDRGPMLEAIGA